MNVGLSCRSTHNGAGTGPPAALARPEREREREIGLCKTRHTKAVSYHSRRRRFHEWIHTLEHGPHWLLVGESARAPLTHSTLTHSLTHVSPRTRAMALHTGLNQTIQSALPSGATSSPSAQGGARRKDAPGFSISLSLSVSLPPSTSGGI